VKLGKVGPCLLGCISCALRQFSGLFHFANRRTLSTSSTSAVSTPTNAIGGKESEGIDSSLIWFHSRRQLNTSSTSPRAVIILNCPTEPTGRAATANNARTARAGTGDYIVVPPSADGMLALARRQTFNRAPTGGKCAPVSLPRTPHNMVLSEVAEIKSDNRGHRGRRPLRTLCQ